MGCMKKVIIYCRRAKHAKDEYEYRFLRKMYPDAKIVGEYFEQRPTCMSEQMSTELINRAEKGEFDMLVVESGERIARDSEFIFGFICEMQKHGVTILFDRNSLCIKPCESAVMKLYRLFAGK